MDPRVVDVYGSTDLPDPQSIYGFDGPSTRHLGTIERSQYILPRIRIPDDGRGGDIGMRTMEPLTPLSFHIPRINPETGTPYGTYGGIAPYPLPLGHYPPPPPSNIDQEMIPYPQQDMIIPSGAMLAPTQLISSPIDETERKALNDNTAISFQSILFNLLRYPCLICVFISASLLWGRGKNVKKVGEEEETSIAAFTTGCTVLLSLLFLSDHRNQYLRAKILIWSRHMISLIAVAGSVVTIVFASLTLSPLQDDKAVCVDNNCMSTTERLTYNAVLIGASSLLLMMALFGLIMGCVGIYLMNPLLKEEKAILEEKERAARDNQAMHF